MNLVYNYEDIGNEYRSEGTQSGKEFRGGGPADHIGPAPPEELF
jgi:hypothetical protein